VFPGLPGPNPTHKLPGYRFESRRTSTAREWWETRRQDFELFISPEVLGEAAKGDPEAARLRLAAIATFPLLAVTEEVEELNPSRKLEKLKTERGTGEGEGQS